MAKKTLEKKTIKRWGKGGNLVSLILIFCLFLQPVAFAARSSAGGGKVAKFDVGKWAIGTGIGLASMGVGNAVSNAVFTDATLATNLRGLGTFSTWGNNYAIIAGTNQVGRAVGAMGTYYGWNPKSTIFVSSLATGMASGGINPGQFGSEGVLTNSVVGLKNGIALGAISGSIEGGILSGLADKKGQLPIWAGPAAGMAGNFATGYVVNGFSTGLSTSKDNMGYVDTEKAFQTYRASQKNTVGPLESKNMFTERRLAPYIEANGIPQDLWVPVEGVGIPVEFSFKNKFTTGQKNLIYSQGSYSRPMPIGVATHSTFRNSFIGGVVKSIPASVLSFGVQSMVKNKDWQDAYIVKQAFTGVYPVVNYTTDDWLRKRNIDGEAGAINREKFSR